MTKASVLIGLKLFDPGHMAFCVRFTRPNFVVTDEFNVSYRNCSVEECCHDVVPPAFSGGLTQPAFTDEVCNHCDTSASFPASGAVSLSFRILLNRFNPCDIKRCLGRGESDDPTICVSSGDAECWNSRNAGHVRLHYRHQGWSLLSECWSRVPFPSVCFSVPECSGHYTIQCLKGLVWSLIFKVRKYCSSTLAFFHSCYFSLIIAVNLCHSLIFCKCSYLYKLYFTANNKLFVDTF